MELTTNLPYCYFEKLHPAVWTYPLLHYNYCIISTLFLAPIQSVFSAFLHWMDFCRFSSLVFEVMWFVSVFISALSTYDPLLRVSQSNISRGSDKHSAHNSCSASHHHSPHQIRSYSCEGKQNAVMISFPASVFLSSVKWPVTQQGLPVSCNRLPNCVDKENNIKSYLRICGIYKRNS